MNIYDFDITFCKGEIPLNSNNKSATKVCPIRDKCRRYWTDNYQKEANRLKLRYFSFVVPDGTFMSLVDLKNNNCSLFWENKNED